MNRDVSVVIPTIAPRADMLQRAIRSVMDQSHPASMVIVVNDINGDGAPITRTRGLRQVCTTWTAFLDDDDELLPQHLEHLLDCAEATGADMVFPWFHVVGGTDPFPQHFGRQFDRADPTQTTITMLIRTDVALQAGGFLEPGEHLDGCGHRAGEDFRFVLRVADSGAKIVHLPERTWSWHHHPGNLSGRAWRQK